MSRDFERESPTLFATLLASAPARRLHIKLIDFLVASAMHLAIFWILIWLTTHTARPVLAFESSVNTLMLPDHAALSLKVAKAGDVLASAAGHKNGRTGTARAAITLPDALPLPELNEVVAATAKTFEGVVAANFADELIRSAASQLGISLARDTMPYIPTVEELSKGPLLTPTTSGAELLNRKEIALLLQERYPPDLIDWGVQGEAAVWLLIDTSGTVRQARIAKSSRTKRLDRIALDVVPRMKFKPASNRGIPTNVWVQLPVRFQIVYDR